MLMQEVMVFYLLHAIVRIGRTMNVSIKFPTFFAKKISPKLLRVVFLLVVCGSILGPVCVLVCVFCRRA